MARRPGVSLMGLLYTGVVLSRRGQHKVIQVNWTHSKTRQDFAERAKELIRLSKGEIRAVVNVDLDEIYRAGLKDGVKTGGLPFRIRRYNDCYIIWGALKEIRKQYGGLSCHGQS